MPNMRAKVQILSIVKHSETQETITAAPVSSKPYGPEGESEDNTFARWTPGGKIELSITNPNLVGQFKQGQKFYVDFTETAE